MKFLIDHRIAVALDTDPSLKHALPGWDRVLANDKGQASEGTLLKSVCTFQCSCCSAIVFFSLLFFRSEQVSIRIIYISISL
jgi:hypothetical protein